MQSALTVPDDSDQPRPARFTSFLALVVWLLAVVAQAGMLAYLPSVESYRASAGVEASPQSDPVMIAFTFLMASLGAVIVLRAASRRYGWLMLATGFSLAVGSFTMAYSQYALLVAAQANLPLGSLAGWVQDLWMIQVVQVIFLLPVLFPDGRLPSLRWRAIFWPTLAAWGLLALVFAFAQRPLTNAFIGYATPPRNPVGIIPGSMLQYQVVLAALLTVTTVTAVASLVYRWRVAGGEMRQQIKWVLYAFLLMLLTHAVLLVSGSLLKEWAGVDLGLERMLEVVIRLSLLGLVAALGIAALKYRLYDIDLIISRMLVYGALTAIIVATYVFFVAGVGALLPIEGDLLLSLVAASVIAMLFNPLRARLQRAANRLMFGERDDPYAVLSRLGRQLQETTVPGQTLSVITGSICQALKLPYAAIQLLTGEGDRQTVAVTGQSAAGLEEWPLLYQGETVGWLAVAPRWPGEAFNTRERQLLADIAAQAGAAAYSVRLTTALQRSREKLVLAREEERRRIRRDLHDGLGPSLASQTFKLDAALELLQNDPQAVAQLLKSLKEQNQRLVADIRRLVYELRPPALDELGLAGALKAHADKINSPTALRITVLTKPDPLPVLPAAVEVAAYRIALEGITNVVRHAQARECTVTVEAKNARLMLTVGDDGVGPPPEMRPGVGLASMRERAEELGGFIEIAARHSHGTRVTAMLPTDGSYEQHAPTAAKAPAVAIVDEVRHG